MTAVPEAPPMEILIMITPGPGELPEEPPAEEPLAGPQQAMAALLAEIPAAELEALLVMEPEVPQEMEPAAPRETEAELAAEAEPVRATQEMEAAPAAVGISSGTRMETGRNTKTDGACGKK